MSKYRNYILFIVILASAAIIIGSKAKAWSKPEKKSKAIVISLPEISKNSKLMAHEKVKIRCRFATCGTMFRKNDDIFTPENFENFSVWEDKIKFWDNAELKNVYPTLYVAKSNQKTIDKIRMLQRFTEIEITGTIESVYANMPWIRVENIELIARDELDQTMVSQIKRANDFIAQNEFQKAKICMEIAQENQEPQYVHNYIVEQQEKIEYITRQKIQTEKAKIASDLLTQARNNARTKNYEKAATAYGKALQASEKYKKSAAIHKEIAGFFIDFYQEDKDTALLEYSIKEFQKANRLSNTKDSDILYALAYIENIKAKKTHNYTKAEKLAKECLAINSLHYGGRKLLTEIMSAQLSYERNTIKKPLSPVKNNNSHINNKIDQILDRETLLAMDEEIADIGKSLNIADKKITKIKEIIESDNDKLSIADTAIKGITATDFQGLLVEEDIIVDTANEFNKAENELINTVLPDFPVSSIPLNSKLPELAM